MYFYRKVPFYLFSPNVITLPRPGGILLFLSTFLGGIIEAHCWDCLVVASFKLLEPTEGEVRKTASHELCILENQGWNQAALGLNASSVTLSHTFSFSSAAERRVVERIQ